MFDVDTASIAELESELKFFRKKAYPFATRGLVNGLAVSTQRKARRDIKKKFVTRTPYTWRNVNTTLDRRELRVDKQAAHAGMLADYMKSQEFGATYDDKTGQFEKDSGRVAIPRPLAAGQQNTRPTRTKAVIPKLRRGQLKVKRMKQRVANKGQRNLPGVVRHALKNKQRIIYHKWKNGHAGIYQIRGQFDGKTRGTLRGIKLVEIYDLSKKRVDIKPNPTLEPASLWASDPKRRDKIFRKELIRQLKRWKLLGN